jgi:hypothetical protein
LGLCLVQSLDVVLPELPELVMLELLVGPVLLAVLAVV